MNSEAKFTTNSSQQTIQYFSAYQNYFWRWAENGTVIEFSNQRTICYREDLTNVLTALPKTTSLSLGTIFLILCACKDNWQELYEVRQGFRELIDLGADNDLALRRQSFTFLNIINRLPQEYRSAQNRTLLLQAIFEELTTSGVRTGLQPLIKEFNSGVLDDQIFSSQQELSSQIIIQDLAPLAAARAIFNTTESLLTKLRTGLISIPEPIKLIPDEQKDKDLLDQLADDEQTKSLSTLTKRILAALAIPMHLSGSSDQDLGGISDIANKGTYDKLLLSELAQDDHLLTARLANNEALFLKREATPKQQGQELNIMIDTTIKMWGSSRIFALATALAFREGKQKNQSIKVICLTGKNAQMQSLASKADVINLLEQMDIAMHCGDQLLHLFKNPIVKKDKYILITSFHFLKDAATIPYFTKVRDKLDYLVSVSPDGHLQLYHFNKSKSKLVREARISLNELLNKDKKGTPTTITQPNLPSIIYQNPPPLHYPTSKIRLLQNNVYQYKNMVIAISVDKRVLCWLSDKYGAIELIPQINPGRTFFGQIDEQVFLLVIADKGDKLNVYNITPETVDYQVVEQLLPKSEVGDFQFHHPYFYFMSQGEYKSVDPYTGKVQFVGFKIPVTKSIANTIGNLGTIKKYINNGYSAINSCKTIYITITGSIFLDKKSLDLVNEQHLWQEHIIIPSIHLKPIKQENLIVQHLGSIRFTKYTFKDGSTMVMDSRGLLHLKSSNPHIPEISIIVIVGQPTACWSADGFLSGSRYFIGNSKEIIVKPSVFRQKYLTPFINSINWDGTTT